MTWVHAAYFALGFLLGGVAGMFTVALCAARGSADRTARANPWLTVTPVAGEPLEDGDMVSVGMDGRVYRSGAGDHESRGPVRGATRSGERVSLWARGTQTRNAGG